MIGSESKSNQPDEALARLAANGNAAAFDEIYSRHRSFVYNIALRMTGNPADAEDLTQESFISVLRRVGAFRGDASFTTWLYRVVVNQVKMHFRYRGSRPETQTSDGEIPESWPGVSRPPRSRRTVDRSAGDREGDADAPAWLPGGIHPPRHRRLQARRGRTVVGPHGWHFEVKMGLRW